jgi:flagellar hook protein FlgE
MSITKTLYTGVSGLTAHGRAIGVVGDNIANVNTTGYKSERAIFQDLLGRSMMSANQPGSGVKMAAITREFAQGTLLTTESPTDLAINGRGFFILRGSLSGQQGNFFSRAGQFSLDNNGNLVDPQGFIVQGYLVNSAGSIDNQLTDLSISESILTPEPTDAIDIAVNLDSTETEPLPFDSTDPGSTSNFATSIDVYDSLGNEHRVDVFFRREAADNEWTWHAVVDDGEVGGTPGVNNEVANGRLNFTSTGELDMETDLTAWSATFNGASPQTVTFDFGDSLTTDAGTGLAGSTQFASTSSVVNQSQNGYSSGELVSVGVQSNGDVMAIYTNGEQRLVGQVALATFESEGRLARAGNSLWMETQESGAARVGSAGNGPAGTISGNALEMSTVDLSQEFVNLISYQRGFQANSRTVTTADQMYQEAVNLKR